MLQELSIKNFAIIDDLRVSFSDGLTIWSGETGAGKSIILQAVNLLLGGRAGAAMIRAGAEMAELEALFAISPESRTAGAMKAYEYDPEDGLLIRRIISSSDRHKIYINGKLATIHMLAEITENLASISGQHAHQRLLKEDQHLSILDQFGGLLGLRSEVYSCYHTVSSLTQKLRQIQASALRQSERMDLLMFQKQEIRDADIKPDEDTEIETERVRLKQARMLYQSVHECLEGLYAGGGAVSEQLSVIVKVLDKICLSDPALSAVAKMLKEAGFLIEDAAGNLRAYLKKVDTDENRLEILDVRIDFLHKLKRKYGGSLDSVLKRLYDVETELSEIEHVSDAQKEIRQDLLQHHDQLCRKVRELSLRRTESAAVLAAQVEAELSMLRMPHTRFQIDLKTVSGDEQSEPFMCCDGKLLTDSGVDRAVLMIAPNVGESLKPLSQIASGGELSRVVLALKAILSEADAVDTVIFDEVDAGIGGSVAEVVGKKLLDISRRYQVICITHLPQIARFGKHHFKIFKDIVDGRTTTTIQPLAADDRVHELARMLGGGSVDSGSLGTCPGDA